MKTKVSVSIWVLQIITAIIFLFVGINKFFGGEVDIHIFSSLGMEPHGRYIIAVLESVSGLLLLSSGVASIGSLFGVGIMLGAIIAHITVLGLNVQGDNGMHIGLLLFVLISCLIITYKRREQIPLIGRTLKG